MSLRSSASRPSICSGDMYCIVPTMVPCEVSGESWGLGELTVKAAETSGAEPLAATKVFSGLANPKSSSFAAGRTL